nr:DNA-processing protein DprA [Streptomyces spiralis]
MWDMTTYDTELILSRTVTITGTRSTGHKSLTEYAQLFSAYLGPFATGAHFYIGGAKGIDSLSLVWLAGNTQAALTVVVPGTVEQQPAEARQAIARVRERISEMVELAAPDLNSASYHARNRWMVDRSSMTIGFPLAGQLQSGTWQTLNYTRGQGKPHLVVPI